MIRALALSFLLAVVAFGAPTNIPTLNRPVMDEAALLEAHDVKRIEDFLFAFQQSGKIQMAVFITPSLEGLDIESYSIEVAKKWQLGEKKKDQGLLLIIAPNERRMRLEVGYGLEGDITDAFSRRVLQNTIAPYFRANRHGDGILVAVEEIARKLGVDLTAPVARRMSSAGKGRQPFGSFIFFILFFGLILLFIFANAGLWFTPRSWRRRSRGGGYWSSGSSGWGGGGGGWSSGSGGGGFSGGGGGFGGGGASSSW